MSQTKGNVKKAGIGYLIGNYLIRGMGFITLPIFSRLLSTSDFGIFNTYTSYESIFFIFIGLAVHTSLKNAYLKYEKDFDNYVSLCILIILINMLLFLLCGNIFSRMTNLVPNWYVTILVLNGFATAIITFYNTYLGIFYKSGNYLKIAGINAIGNVVCSLLLIFTVYSDERSTGRIIGRFLPTFLISIYLVYFFWKTKKPSWNSVYVKYGLRYSIPLIPHAISQVLLSSGDRIMIASMVGNAEAGIYSFAYTLYSIVSVTYSSLGQVWSPWFYEQFKKNRIDNIREVATKYALCIALFSIVVMLIAPEVLIIMGSENYRESIYIVVPIMLGGFFSYLYNFPAIVEYYFEETKYISLGTILSAIINVILNYVFINLYGYQAAAYTTLITYALYFIFHYFISLKINQYKKIYDGCAFARIVFLYAIAGILCQIFIESMLIRWILAICVGIAFIYCIEKEFHILDIIKKKFTRR